jgi:hypothetical protein
VSCLNISILLQLRVQFFMALKAAEDVEVQKRGVVIIFYRTKGPLYAERTPAMLAQFVYVQNQHFSRCRRLFLESQ